MIYGLTIYIFVAIFRFSEFKEVLIGMVESHSFELFLYETVVDLHAHDLSVLQQKRVRAKVKAADN